MKLIIYNLIIVFFVLDSAFSYGFGIKAGTYDKINESIPKVRNYNSLLEPYTQNDKFTKQESLFLDSMVNPEDKVIRIVQFGDVFYSADLSELLRKFSHGKKSLPFDWHSFNDKQNIQVLKNSIDSLENLILPIYPVLIDYIIEKPNKDIVICNLTISYECDSTLYLFRKYNLDSSKIHIEHFIPELCLSFNYKNCYFLDVCGSHYLSLITIKNKDNYSSFWLTGFESPFNYISFYRRQNNPKELSIKINEMQAPNALFKLSILKYLSWELFYDNNFSSDVQKTYELLINDY